MKWVTKAALVCLGISMVAMAAASFGQLKFWFVVLPFTLALILALLAILEAPSAEGNSYLFSILTGIAAGFIIVYIFFTSWAEIFPIGVGSSIEKDEIPTLIFVSNVPPILVMIYSLLLSRMHPYAWKEIRVRLISIALLILAYLLGSCLFFAFFVGATSIFLVTLYWFFAISFNGIILWIEKMFLYSNIVTIIAAYIATIGIGNHLRRAILALGLILLMNIVASSPLTLAQFFT